MNLLLCVVLQSLLAAPPPGEDLPRIGDLDVAERLERPSVVYPWIGIEPVGVWTNWESGLHVKDGWGVGADLTVTLDYGTRAFLGFRLGAIGWNTRSDIPSSPFTEVRQYRIGVFGEFPFRFLEIGVGANVGGYRIRRDGDNDTAGYFEFQGMIGVRPSEFVWMGIVGMQTFTSTSFNHSTDHFYVNYSIGPALEVRF